MFTTSNRLRPASTQRFDFALQPLDRLFDQLFEGLHPTSQAGEWSAPWAWWEDDAHVHLEIELPGVKSEDLELVAHDGHLRLKCERKAPEGERQYGYNNRRYGNFERVIALPETVDTQNVTAEMRDGILYVTLGKVAQAQPKRIAVQTG